MCRFVPYIRTAEGYIERVSFAIYNSRLDVLYPYIHEQCLLGWPEPKVFWAAKSGPCVGVAPVTRPTVPVDNPFIPAGTIGPGLPTNHGPAECSPSQRSRNGEPNPKIRSVPDGASPIKFPH